MHTNDNVRNKATTWLAVATARSQLFRQKLSSITGARASKAVDAAKWQALAPLTKIVASRLQERVPADVQANNN